MLQNHVLVRAILRTLIQGSVCDIQCTRSRWNMVLSALTPIIALTWKLHKQVSVCKILYLIFAMIYGVCCSYLLLTLITRYFPITEGFDICVKNLRFIAKAYNTTYEAVNIFIFIIAWILSIGWNIMIAKLIQKDKITLSFLAMVASSITLLSFIIRT